MEINNLIIELSRKCNLNCAHCLRGSSRRDTIDFNKLHTFLSNINYIGDLTIGGGEPSLALKELKDLYYLLNNVGVVIGNIYIVTNGTYKIKELTEMFIEFYNICDDNEMSKLAFSFDIWHNNAMYGRTDYRKYHFNQAYDILMQYGLEDKLIKHSTEKWSYVSIIKMGRARDWGARELEPYNIEIGYYDGYAHLYDEQIYYTVDGLLFSSCDLSYLEMNKHSKFYIGEYNENLLNSINRYNNKLDVLNKTA